MRELRSTGPTCPSVRSTREVESALTLRSTRITVAALVSIALGTLLGASLYKWLTETFGWWQLRIGHVGSYVRRGRKK